MTYSHIAAFFDNSRHHSMSGTRCFKTIVDLKQKHVRITSSHEKCSANLSGKQIGRSPNHTSSMRRWDRGRLVLCPLRWKRNESLRCRCRHLVPLTNWVCALFSTCKYSTLPAFSSIKVKQRRLLPSVLRAGRGDDLCRVYIKEPATSIDLGFPAKGLCY